MAFVHLYIPALSHEAHAGSSHDFPAQPSFSHEIRLKDQTRTIKDHLPARFGFRPGYAATMGILCGNHHRIRLGFFENSIEKWWFHGG